jgi:hypothetical protein
MSMMSLEDHYKWIYTGKTGVIRIEGSNPFARSTPYLQGVTENVSLTKGNVTAVFLSMSLHIAGQLRENFSSDPRRVLSGARFQKSSAVICDRLLQ